MKKQKIQFKEQVDGKDKINIQLRKHLLKCLQCKVCHTMEHFFFWPVLCNTATQAILQHKQYCNTNNTATLQYKQHCNTSNTATQATLQNKQHCNTSITGTNAKNLALDKYCAIHQHRIIHSSNASKFCNTVKAVLPCCATPQDSPKLGSYIIESSSNIYEPSFGLFCGVVQHGNTGHFSYVFISQLKSVLLCCAIQQYTNTDIWFVPL